jgi:hypothetical protein
MVWYLVKHRDTFTFTLILSLFISLVLCFKSTVLVPGIMLLTVRNWTSWSDRPFIMGHVEDELSLVIA